MTYSIQQIPQRRAYQIHCACQKLMHANGRIEGFCKPTWVTVWLLVHLHTRDLGRSDWESKKQLKPLKKIMQPPKNHALHYKNEFVN